ncbi:hypothetical protein [Propionibacterium freudenreichii]|uniref:hypothetical protein n=1 Tax=Propionibacterium freudenreichii TaxID=1744 RepID=UPI00254D9A29|nr:hypothetical protein [Propionibacterium freudenreichii]MDK9661423.1 hypothetical protein [Propionibacterium freudenreichii]
MTELSRLNGLLDSLTRSQEQLLSSVNGQLINNAARTLRTSATSVTKAWKSASDGLHRDLENLTDAALAARESAVASSRTVYELKAETDQAIKAAGRTAAAEVSRHQDLLEQAEATLRSARRNVTWVTVGRIATALIPTLMTVLIIGSLFSGAWQALGVAPIMAWVWKCFAAAHAWWGKVIIAALGVAGMAVLVLVGAWVAHKVQELFE